MEQHPVPQNVTGFQFKLIGDITLKQFAYLAGGLLLGYITTKLTVLPSLLLFPLAALFALLGFGLAFVPIEERPLDRWLFSFIKRIYFPTQYVWRKNNPAPHVLIQAMSTQPPIVSSQPQLQPAVNPASPLPPHVSLSPKPAEPLKPLITPPPPRIRPQMRVVATTPIRIAHPAPTTPQPASWTTGPLRMTPTTTSQPASVSESALTGQRMAFSESQPTPSQPPSAPPKTDVTKIESKYQATERRLSDQINSLQKELAQGTIARERLIELQQVLVELATEKERLSQELRDIKQKLASGQMEPAEKPFAQTVSSQPTLVKIVTPHVATHVGIPKLTSQPNIITGILKDSKGALLPNIIVTVKDKEGVPVRALKTNKLGQFAASTPLTNGTYFVEIDDPKKTFQFKRIEVTLTSQVLPPVNISAINDKDIIREKLSQDLFGRSGI